MRTGPDGVAAQKFRSMSIIATRADNDETRVVLTNMVESYRVLTDEQRAEYDAMAASPIGRKVNEMISVYKQQGIEEGIEQGIEQGIEEGMILGERRTLLKLLTLRFGPLPTAVQAKVAAISDLDKLDALAELVLTAPTLDATGL